MFGRERFGPFQEYAMWCIVFAPHPFHAINIHHINGVLWPSPIPNRVTRVSKMQQYVEIALSGIVDAIEIIKKLASSANSLFRVCAVNDPDPIPFIKLVRMPARAIHGDIMSSL